MPSITLEYNEEVATVPQRSQTIQTLKIQAQTVFQLTTIPASRVVIVDKHTSIKAFSPSKIDGGIPFNPQQPAIHPIHDTHRVGPFLSPASHDIYFLDANVVVDIVDPQRRNRNHENILMIVNDPTIVLVISETCLAEVQHLVPGFTGYPNIHYTSSGQPYSRKDMIFEHYYRLCKFEMPFSTLHISMQRSMRNDFFVFLEACFIAGGPSFQQAVFSVLTENNQMIDRIRNNVAGVQTLIHSYGFHYYLPLTTVSELLDKYSVQ